MGYDIPDEIKYREKIVFNLDWKQLGYAILFGILAILSYGLQINGSARFILPSLFVFAGIAFIVLNLEQKVLDRLSYVQNIHYAHCRSDDAQRFFEIKSIKDDLICLDNGSKIGIFKVQPVNFRLMDDARKKVLLINYKGFLNQIITPVQVMIKTVAVDLQDYFENIEKNRTKNDMTELYADFRQFEENLLGKKSIKQRDYYLIANYHSGLTLEQVQSQMQVLGESLSSCGLLCKRLGEAELLDLLLSYGGEKKHSEIPPETFRIKIINLLKRYFPDLFKTKATDLFRDMITPSFDFSASFAIVNGEYHKVVKVKGYPRKVEDGWLQAFLCKNEDYDISIHIAPTSIDYTLVYLHNQIVQQSGDLAMSTSKGTPNPALEIKKNDTMRVYDSLYKGEEKMFRVSVYIDNKAPNIEQLDLLVEKCKSNLNSQIMIPETVNWRIADAIKSTLPLAEDELETNREILTGALMATFPFISSGNSNPNGILFAHEMQTDNPIFLDLENQSNKHFFIIGISGSGKSYAAKYLAIQQLFKEESKLYLLDPNGEYGGLCTTLGGDVIEISRESKSILNLFDMGGDDLGGKMLQLISAFDIIMDGLNESQKAIVSDAISQVYAKKGIKSDKSTWSRVPPCFSDLIEVLEEMRGEINQSSPQARSLESLYRRVKMYSRGGVFEFLDKNTQIRSKNDILCFDLSKLPTAIKPLMIFMVLDFIQRQIKKDKEPKTVLIDEGWVLLKSKEAGDYLLEFVKTSRKFNGSIGFITQEVEDLLQSSTGKSILNTASIKILMHQSASTMTLLSSTLRLNDFEENFLLSAKKGQGLIIAEDNSYCFSIEAPPKMHRLITTNPNEKFVEPDKDDKKIKLDYERGLYVRDELGEKQIAKLMNNQYELYRTRISNDQQYIHYLVKVRQNESTQHAFLCWYTVSLLASNGLRAKQNPTRDPDIEVTAKKKKYCFEIETGKRLGKVDRVEMEARFHQKSGEYENVYLIVPNEQIARRYIGICKNVITLAELNDAIRSFSLALSN